MSGTEGPSSGGLLPEPPASARSVTPWTVFQAVAALLALAALLYATRDVLTPFLLFWILLAFLLPFREHDGFVLLVSTTAIITLIWMLVTTGFLLAPFVLALGMAYMLDPLVDRLEERGMKRTPAVLVLAVPGVGVLLLVVLVGFPALGEQIAEIITRAPDIVPRLADLLESLDRRLATLTLPAFLQEMVARLRGIDAASIVAILEERQEAIVRRAWGAVLGLGRGLGSFLTVVGYVVLTPVLTFYLLRDWDGLTRSLAELVPQRRREAVVGFAREYDHLLSRYLRGQLTVGLMIGALTGVGLFLTGFPYAFLIGVFVAVFSVVPYLGLVLSLIPAVLVALLSGAVWTSLLKVAVVFAVAQGLEGAVISPRIVGGSVGLHPVWVVLALTMGGFYFGFVGLLLAVPIAVGVKLVVERALGRYRSTALFQGGAGVEADLPLA
jgi:predicted PurR-regulated permease PerM